MIEVYTECIVGLTHHAEHSSIRIHMCICISRSEPYGMCFEAFCCRFFDTGIHFNVIWFIMFSLGRAYGQSSLKLTIIHLKPNKHMNASAYVRVHRSRLKQKHCIKWETIRYTQFWTCCTCKRFSLFFEACFIAVNCCKLTCYILYSTSLWQPTCNKSNQNLMPTQNAFLEQTNAKLWK